jgi:hypothetical protein
MCFFSPPGIIYVFVLVLQKLPDSPMAYLFLLFQYVHMLGHSTSFTRFIFYPLTQPTTSSGSKDSS